jgi:hypothetical protein
VLRDFAAVTGYLPATSGYLAAATSGRTDVNDYLIACGGFPAIKLFEKKCIFVIFELVFRYRSRWIINI